MPKHDLPIVIAGAGPAGSTLAIRLCRAGHSVVLVERYKFPRAKLCGEFISPECLAHFDELGVLDEMLASGGDQILETRFYETRGRSVAVPSRWFHSNEGFALSLSRARMDEILLNAARQSGAEIREETSVVGLINDESGAVSGVKIKKADGRTVEIGAATVVDATGRARVLSRFAEKHSSKQAPKPKFVGLKTHLTGATVPTGVCEIYAFRGGYAGLSNVEDGESNLCLIARSSLMKDRNANAIFAELRKQNARAAETLLTATPTHDWLAVSVPSIGLNSPPAIKGLFTIGDSAAFVDPFTGSGMLLAMQSSTLLADTVASVGVDHDMLAHSYYSAFERQFRPRLSAAGIIRRVAYEPIFSSLAVGLLSISKKLPAMLARKMHSTDGQISR
jgi:flavin-dependent dehydrogenase